MFAYVVALIGGGILFLNMYLTTISQDEQAVQRASQSRVTRLLIIKHAAGDWFTVNPLYSGVISPANIATKLPLGGQNDPSVVALVSGGQLFTYTTSPANKNDITVLGEITHCAELSGQVIAGNSYRPNCLQVGAGTAVLPAVIPVGSLVSIGKS